jgi:hypothetical protein
MVSLPPGSPSLFDELRSALARPLGDSPASKDLPRLVGRITVQTLAKTANKKPPSASLATLSASGASSLAAGLNLSGGSQSRAQSAAAQSRGKPEPKKKKLAKAVSVHQFVSQLAAESFPADDDADDDAVRRKTEELDRVAKAMDRNWYSLVDSAILDIEDSEWREMDVPRRVRNELIKAATEYTSSKSDAKTRDDDNGAADDADGSDDVDDGPQHLPAAVVDRAVTLTSYPSPAATPPVVRLSKKFDPQTLSDAMKALGESWAEDKLEDSAADSNSLDGNGEDDVAPSLSASMTASLDAWDDEFDGDGDGDAEAAEIAAAAKLRAEHVATNRTRIEEIYRVVHALAENCGDDGILADVDSFFRAELAKEDVGGDLQLLCDDLFETVVERSLPMAQTLKLIHQNIIFMAIFHLRATLPMLDMTMDVRGPEGWKILIAFRYGCVSVCHRRREQSLAAAPPEEQYWFEWELMVRLSRDFKEVSSAVLRITNLGFGDGASAKFRERISRMTMKGNLIVTGR